MRYMVTKPRWMRPIYGPCLWSVPGTEKRLYLTFDDGPHPDVTPFVLDELARWGAKATFFCLGRQVERHPDLYERILREGHAVGNHSHEHPDGWRAANRSYYADIAQARRLINSRLFRPPHGHITAFQSRHLARHEGYRIVLWNVLSGDFDPHTTPDACTENVRKHARAGSIVVFHDSPDAARNLQVALPETLRHFHSSGFQFAALPSDI